MPHVSIQPDVLFTAFGFPVTNTLITAWLAILVLATFAFFVSRAIKTGGAKSRFALGAEIVVGGLLDFLSNISGSRETARRHFPIVATVFLFVLTANWMGILPGVGSIGIWEGHGESEVLVPIFRTANSSLNLTLALALIVVVFSHIIGIRSLGGGHAKKFFNFSNPIQFFVGILEAISEVAKVISFSFRLFGNMFAGEVLLVIMSFLIPIFIPIPFLGLELFVGLIQAAIFAVLAMIFFTAAEEMPAH